MCEIFLVSGKGAISRRGAQVRGSCAALGPHAPEGGREETLAIAGRPLRPGRCGPVLHSGRPPPAAHLTRQLRHRLSQTSSALILKLTRAVGIITRILQTLSLRQKRVLVETRAWGGLRPPAARLSSRSPRACEQGGGGRQCAAGPACDLGLGPQEPRVASAHPGKEEACSREPRGSGEREGLRREGGRETCGAGDLQEGTIPGEPCGCDSCGDLSSP